MAESYIKMRADLLDTGNWSIIPPASKYEGIISGLMSDATVANTNATQ